MSCPNTPTPQHTHAASVDSVNLSRAPQFLRHSFTECPRGTGIIALGARHVSLSRPNSSVHHLRNCGEGQRHVADGQKESSNDGSELSARSCQTDRSGAATLQRGAEYPRNYIPPTNTPPRLSPNICSPSMNAAEPHTRAQDATRSPKPSWWCRCRHAECPRVLLGAKIGFDHLDRRLLPWRRFSLNL